LENPVSGNHGEMIARVENSGHAPIIRRFVQDIYLREDPKKKTFLFESESNCGKTRFKERLMTIFPS